MKSRKRGAGSREHKSQRARVISVGRQAESSATATCLLLIAICPAANAQAPFSFNDVKYWVGSGSNRAALVIDWGENSTEPPALAWGYRWNGAAHGSDMLAAIIADDRRLFGKLGGSQANPQAVYGVGYDTDDDRVFGIDDGTQFDSLGFAFTDPSDLAAATDPGDYYAEGWFAGFWHYGVATANPYDGGNWSDIGIGMASRTLADGAWDSWTFSPTFNFASFAENPVAAEPPSVPGDFNHDGHVDEADYAAWRTNFGSTLTAADYVTWRLHFSPAATGNGAFAGNVPEPSTVLLFAIFSFRILIRRKPLMNANHR